MKSFTIGIVFMLNECPIEQGCHAIMEVQL